MSVTASVANKAAASHDPGMRRPAEIAGQPEHHAAQLAVVGEHQHQRHQRAAGAGHHDAGEQHARRWRRRAPAPAPASVAEHARRWPPQHCTTHSEPPTSSANKAPTDEPPDTPRTYESASGLRNSACNSTPASASSAPMRERRQQPRRAQFQHHGAGRFGEIAEQRRDGRTHADVGGSGDQAQARDDDRERARAWRIAGWRTGAKVTRHCPITAETAQRFPLPCSARVPPGKTCVMSDWIDAEGYRANVGIVLMRDNGEVFLGQRTGASRLAVSAGRCAPGRACGAGAVSRAAGRDRTRRAST